MASVSGRSFAALIAVGVGAGTWATCGTEVGAAGIGVFVTGGGTRLDLPADESSSSLLILKGRLDITPFTVFTETASAPAISSSDAPVWRRLVTTIPTSDSDGDVLAFATYVFTTFTETASLSAMS